MIDYQSTLQWLKNSQSVMQGEVYLDFLRDGNPVTEAVMLAIETQDWKRLQKLVASVELHNPETSKRSLFWARRAASEIEKADELVMPSRPETLENEFSPSIEQ